MKVKIYITLKEGIHDPQGQAVHHSLHSLGFDAVQDVRVGKLLEVEVEDSEKEIVEANIKDMCQKLLANTVIEDFQYEVVDS